MDEPRNLYIVEPKDFEEKPRYEIKTGEALNRHISTHCFIQPARIPNVETHLLVIAYHPLGGVGTEDGNLT